MNKEYYREYRHKHRDRINANARKYDSNNPIKRRSRRLKRLFGITLEQYQALWDEQKGLCAICGGPETATDGRTKKLKWLSVDHNHQTGKVRALLCQNCNSVIGHAAEDPAILKQAIAYLEQHNV